MTDMTMADWQTLSNRINRVAPSATLAVDSKAKAMKAAGIDVIGFGAGEPNFPTPAPIVAAAACAVQDPKNYRYTPTAGLPELRKAIADKVSRDSGYEVDPSQVVVTNGGKQAVYEAFQILLDEGDEVIIPAPYWTSYPEAVKLAGGVPVEVFAGADRNFEPDIDAIEAARTERTKAIIVTTRRGQDLRHAGLACRLDGRSGGSGQGRLQAAGSYDLQREQHLPACRHRSRFRPA